MININEILSGYAATNNFEYVAETPSGVNVNEDFAISADTNTTQMFYNIIESGNFAINDDNGRYLTIQRTIQIVFYKRCIKSDEGDNYHPLIFEMENEAQNCFIYIYSIFNQDMVGGLEITDASFDTDVDVLDSNNVACSLNVTLVEKITNC